MTLEPVLDGLNYICSGVSTVLTVLMLVSYRKPKRLKSSDLFFSMALSLVTLPIFILISGARLNIVIGVVLFLLGGLFGGIRGLTVKMYRMDDDVVGRNSMLSLAGWGGSVVLSNVMSSFDSAFLASVGLAPLCFSTGMQVALNSVLMLRRVLMRPQAGEAARPG